MRNLRMMTRVIFALSACVATFGCSDSTSPNRNNNDGSQGGNNGPATGQLSIWTNYSTQIAVGVDGNSVGTTTKYFPFGPPSCGQAGTITLTLAAGTHSVSGMSGQYRWNGTATILPGVCTVYELDAP